MGVNLINALVSGFTVIVKKPAVLLAALFAAVVNIGIFYLVYDQFLDFVYYALYLEILPQTTIYALPMRLFQLYPFEISVLLIGAFLGAIVQVWLVFVLGRFMQDFEKGSAGIVDAIKHATARLKKCFEVAVFLYIIGFIYFVVMLFLMFLGIISDVLSLVLLGVWGLVGIYLLIKLVFLPVVVATDRERLKDALAKTWSFSEKRFFSMVIFLVVVYFISTVLETIGGNLSLMVEDDLISLLILLIFVLASISYSTIAMVKYYLNNK